MDWLDKQQMEEIQRELIRQKTALDRAQALYGTKLPTDKYNETLYGLVKIGVGINDEDRFRTLYNAVVNGINNRSNRNVRFF